VIPCLLVPYHRIGLYPGSSPHYAASIEALVPTDNPVMAGLSLRKRADATPSRRVDAPACSRPRPWLKAHRGPCLLSVTKTCGLPQRIANQIAPAYAPASTKTKLESSHAEQLEFSLILPSFWLGHVDCPWKTQPQPPVQSAGGQPPATGGHLRGCGSRHGPPGCSPSGRRGQEEWSWSVTSGSKKARVKITELNRHSESATRDAPARPLPSWKFRTVRRSRHKRLSHCPQPC